jgi:hypothetical protein
MPVVCAGRLTPDVPFVPTRDFLRRRRSIAGRRLLKSAVSPLCSAPFTFSAERAAIGIRYASLFVVIHNV